MTDIIDLAQSWADAAAAAGDTAGHDVALVAIYGSISRGDWWRAFFTREPDPAAIGITKREAQGLVREWQDDAQAQGVD